MKRNTDINTFNNMEEIRIFQEQFEAMSPEDKKKTATQLFMQLRQASAQLRQMSDQTMFKKLDYLFKVLELGTFEPTFTFKCEKEIQAIMFGEEEETSEDSTKTTKE